MSANYISSAELARRCDVSRAAVSTAIREHRISPRKVRRAGGRVLVEEKHGLSVLGHHAKTKAQPSPSPAPAAVAAPPAADDLGDLLAWGTPPTEPGEPEPDTDPWAHIPEQLRSAIGGPPFWVSWGRIAGPDEPPLSDAEFWEHVHAIVEGMLGEPLDMTPTRLADIAYQLNEAQADVSAGARWDATQWACESARTLLEYPDVQDGTCPHSRPELERLAAGGLLTPELQAAANAALAAYGKGVGDA
jgi:hypothetical protein